MRSCNNLAPKKRPLLSRDCLDFLTAETTSTHATSPANCWGEAYVYDNNTTSAGEFGNLTNINAASSAYTGCTQESLSVTALTNNQLSATGFSYDSSGNILTDGHNTYGFNAESEIKSAASVNYTYDGDGNRVQKSNGKIYWYGAGTEILDESDASGNFTDEYVYLGGKRIAHRVVSGNSIYYYAEDFLGTSRVITTSTGTVCYESDFYPYGGERNITNTCPQNYKFEGKERDTETNNDDFGARYYSSQFGRWLSPDWSAIPAPVPYANLTNPQTLNLYAMVSDNPETFADLDGHILMAPNDLIDLVQHGKCDDQPCAQQAAQNNPANSDKTAQPPSTQSTDLSAAVGTLPLMIGRALAGAELGGEAGAEGGTVLEPGGGTVIGAAAGAIILGTAAALSPNAYAKTKDAIDKATKFLDTAIEHLGKLNNDPAKDPRKGWKDTVRKSADNMDKAAGKIGNKNVAGLVRSTANLMRALIPED
jgi:RHS repeat-associated protein